MKTAILAAAVAALLSTVAEASTEMNERLAEPTVQKLRAAVTDVETTLADLGDLSSNGTESLPPFAVELIELVKSTVAAREARDVQAIEMQSRMVGALEAIVDLMPAFGKPPGGATGEEGGNQPQPA